jgi:hypothetical protein
VSGWLILVGAGLFVSVLFNFYGIYEIITTFIDRDADILINPASEYYIHSYFNLLIFELIVTVLLFIVSTYLIFLFFKKKKVFPEYYILFLVASVVFSVIDCMTFSSLVVPAEMKHFFNEILVEQETEVLRGGIGAAIWIMYMKMSKRVKMTFVED